MEIRVHIFSDRWEVYPLKTESHNGTALQDYTRKCGAPSVLKTDNAQSELGETWTKHCRDQCIGTETTEPHHPWQNPAENRIGSLSAMVRNVLRIFKAPLSKHDWAQKWCCDVHNIAANRQLKWRSPLEINEGHTPDISMFRFHFWEPIWYFDPRTKQPKDNLHKGRWLGIASTAGDAMTYYIFTEKNKGRNVVLIRSVIKSRRKHVGTKEEHVNDDPEYSDFFLTEEEFIDKTQDDVQEPNILDLGEESNASNALSNESSPINQPDDDDDDDDMPDLVQRKEDDDSDSESECDLDESLPPEEQGETNISELHDQFEMEGGHDYSFDTIVDHP